MTNWAILTGEYPPQPGGVSDYTWLVARGLAAAGDRVRVYAPTTSAPPVGEPDVEVLRLPGRFGPRAVARLDRLLLARPRPDRVLVQYVPQAFGWRGMNVGFALWLATRAQHAAPLWVMFHEVATPLVWRPARHAVLAAATRAMARLVAGAAARVFVSVPAWGELLKSIHPRVKPPEWLPVPSTLEEHTAAEGEDGTALRARLAPGGRPLVGHFGTFGVHIATLLQPTLVGLLELVPDVVVLLVGRGSAEFAQRLVALHPHLRERVLATGALAAADVVTHLRACDLLVQPFADGVSSRRTSAMAGLACGLPVVTNLGPLSEPLWAGATAVVPAPDPVALARLAADLLADPETRAGLDRGAEALYRDRFAVAHTVAKLRGGPS